MYLNEESHSEMRRLSRRIELITKFELNNEKYASENFKIMNYGLGGKFKAHLDSVGNVTSNILNIQY